MLASTQPAPQGTVLKGSLAFVRPTQVPTTTLSGRYSAMRRLSVLVMCTRNIPRMGDSPNASSQKGLCFQLAGAIDTPSESLFAQLFGFCLHRSPSRSRCPRPPSRRCTRCARPEAPRLQFATEEAAEAEHRLPEPTIAADGDGEAKESRGRNGQGGVGFQSGGRLATTTSASSSPSSSLNRDPASSERRPAADTALHSTLDRAASRFALNSETHAVVGTRPWGMEGGSWLSTTAMRFRASSPSLMSTYMRRTGEFCGSLLETARAELIRSVVQPETCVDKSQYTGRRLGDSEAELVLSGWYLTGSENIVKQSDSEAYLWARSAGSVRKACGTFPRLF
ncbi:hypothetical protein B0H17DRAFT_1190562 [Mycena rosella]|uniref:Uncharacterized protein n=1 Tax=Mycena rosella TaxID=1033263 RepID=A0AAD7MCL3_MYCRO|nr:hypothetical protein B0H17DRAFT_1190562 [Mycena rosella]